MRVSTRTTRWCSGRPTPCRPGKLEAAGPVFDSAPYGWPVKKGSPLAQSLQKALEHLIASGAYKTIVSNWGLESGAIDKPLINGAIN